MRHARLALFALLVSCGGDDSNGPSAPDRILSVTPDTLALDDCGTSQLVVELRDTAGVLVPGATFSFNSTAGGVAAVSGSGLVAANAPGSATIVVASGGQVVNVPVTVAAVAPTFVAPPDSLVLWPGVSDTLAAGLFSCHGVPTVALSLQAGDPTVATGSGRVVEGKAYGATTISWTLGAQNGQFPVRVIGHPAGTLATVTPLGGTPYGVAVTSTGKVLVTQLGLDALAVGQLPSLALTSNVIGVGVTPPHVTVNPAGTRAYVTNQFGNSVSVVDLVGGAQVKEVPLTGNGFNLLMTRDGAEVYVTTNTGATYVLDASGGKVDSFTVGPVSNGLAEHPTLPYVYISARDGPTVTVYNRQTHAAVDTFVTGGQPQRMAVSNDGSKLYIADESLGLDIWNTVTGQRIQSVAMPAYGLALSPDGSQLVVTSAGPTIRVVDTGTLAFTTHDVGLNTRNATYEPSGRTAIVTDQGGAVIFLR